LLILFIFDDKMIKMESAIFSSESSQDMKLLLELAKKFGIKTKRLNEEDLEEMGFIKAIKDSKTDEFINTDKFLSELK